MARKKATEGTYKKAKPTTSRGNRAKTKPVNEIVPKEIEEEIKIKKYKVKIRKVEDNAIIVNIAGYSKRVYFDLTFNDLDYLRKNKKAFTNRGFKINESWASLSSFSTYTKNINKSINCSVCSG